MIWKKLTWENHLLSSKTQTSKSPRDTFSVNLLQIEDFFKARWRGKQTDTILPKYNRNSHTESLQLFIEHSKDIQSPNRATRNHVKKSELFLN